MHVPWGRRPSEQPVLNVPLLERIERLAAEIQTLVEDQWAEEVESDDD